MRVFIFFFVSFILASCGALHGTRRDRIALVIGNSEYPGIGKDLHNIPINDATAVHSTLGGKLHFVVEPLRTDLNFDQMKDAILNFADRIRTEKYRYAVFYYSGHGVQIENEPFLVPVDANLESDSIKSMTAKQARKEFLSVNMVRTTIETDDSENIFILDACRDNEPGVKGLRDSLEPSRKTLIAYSAGSGQTSSNKPTSTGTSLYTNTFIKEIRNCGKPAKNIFDDLAKRVNELSLGSQQPHYSGEGALSFEFCPREVFPRSVPPA